MEKETISICTKQEVDKLSDVEFKKIYKDSIVFFNSKRRNEVFFLEYANMFTSCYQKNLLIPYYRIDNKILFINDIFGHYEDYKSICILPIKEIIFSQVDNGKTQDTDAEIPFKESFVNGIEFFGDLGIIIKFSSLNCDKGSESLYDYHYVLLNFRLAVLTSSDQIFNKRIKNPVYKNFPFYDENTRERFENFIFKEYPELVKSSGSILGLPNIGRKHKVFYDCKKNLLYLSYEFGKKIDIKSLKKLESYKFGF